MNPETENPVHHLNLTILLTIRHMLAEDRSRSILTFRLSEETTAWIEKLTLEEILHIARVDYFLCDFNNTWKTLQVQTKLSPNSIAQKAYALLNQTAAERARNA